MNLKIAKAELKEDNWGIVRSGESCFSQKTWAKMIQQANKKDEKELIKQLKVTDKRAKKARREA